MSLQNLPILQDISFEIAGPATVKLKDIRTPEMRLSGIQDPVVNQMISTWEQTYQTDMLDEGVDDVFAVAMGVFLNDVLVGSGCLHTVVVSNESPTTKTATATGTMLLAVPDYPEISAAILGALAGYPAPAADGWVITFGLS